MITRSKSRFFGVALLAGLLSFSITGTSLAAASASASGNSAPPAGAQSVPSLAPVEENAVEQAARFFDPLLAEAKDDIVRAALLHQRGVLYLRSHYKQKAVADFNDALWLLPETNEERHDILLHRACALLLLPKPDAQAAIKDINLCLATKPDDPEALLVRADAYRKLGKKDLANADIDRAVLITPRSDTATHALIKIARDAPR